MKKKIITACFFVAIILSVAGFKTGVSKVFYQEHGKNYRSYENKSYEILDTASFYLYYRYQNENKPKGAGLIKTGVYFFSKDVVAPIDLLTVANLKKAYPDNQSFHYAMDAHFKNDTELAAYDPYSKCYKIKYVYTQSLK